MQRRAVAWIAVLALVGLYQFHVYCHSVASDGGAARAAQHRGHAAIDTSLCLACQAAQQLLAVGALAPVATLVALSAIPAAAVPDAPETRIERRPIVPRGPPAFSLL